MKYTQYQQISPVDYQWVQEYCIHYVVNISNHFIIQYYYILSNKKKKEQKRNLDKSRQHISYSF